MRAAGTEELVGRSVELARLTSCLAEYRQAVVVGEAGIGTTTPSRAAAATVGRRVYETGGLAMLVDGLRVETRSHAVALMGVE